MSALPPLAKALSASIEDMVMGQADQAAKEKSRRGPTPKLQRQFEKVRELPRTKQRFVSDMLDTVLQQGAG